MLNIQIRPITQWPGKENQDPKRSPFKSTYKRTLTQLEDELSKCQARTSSLIIEMWIEPRLIRVDGQLRKDARPHKPGIILRFVRETNIRRDPQDTSKWICTPQNVSYPCDAFTPWEDNLRAIALSMESLRRVERYGVFKYDEIISRLALPTAEGKLTTRDEAAAFLATHSGIAMKEILVSDTARSTAYRKAAAELHPDKGGSVDAFTKLQEFNKILGGGWA